MKQILIVDDSPTMRKMVKLSLRDLQDVNFDEAVNGYEAIEKMKVSPFDLMILDLNMPDMHGLDVLKFVLDNHQYKSAPIVILTTKGDDESRREALALGAKCYLTKPFEPKPLSDQIQDLLQ